MLVRIKYATPLLAAFAAAGAAAYSGQAGPQSRPPKSADATPATNPNLVLLDPAHGGPDNGAILGDHFFEKDATLAIAGRLRGVLASRGFTVVSTRDGDPPQALTDDQRAELSNRSHAVACIVLHATRSGYGVHLFASKLQPAAPADSDDESAAHFLPVPWDRAQAGSVDQSIHLADNLRSALAGGGLSVTFGRAYLVPLDDMMCPAVAVEIAPPEVGSDAILIRDAAYQQKIANAIAGGLTTWRKQMTPAPASQSSTPDRRVAP